MISAELRAWLAPLSDSELRAVVSIAETLLMARRRDRGESIDEDVRVCPPFGIRLVDGQ